MHTGETEKSTGTRREEKDEWTMEGKRGGVSTTPCSETTYLLSLHRGLQYTQSAKVSLRGDADGGRREMELRLDLHAPRCN